MNLLAPNGKRGLGVIRRPACGMAVPAFKIFDTNRILRETSVSQLVGYCGSGLVKPPAGTEHIFTRSAPKKIQRPALESRPQEHHPKFNKLNLARSRARQRCTHAHALHTMFTNALLAQTPADRTKVNIGANVCDQANPSASLKGNSAKHSSPGQPNFFSPVMIPENEHRQHERARSAETPLRSLPLRSNGFGRLTLKKG